MTTQQRLLYDVIIWVGRISKLYPDLTRTVISGPHVTLRFHSAEAGNFRRAQATGALNRRSNRVLQFKAEVKTAIRSVLELSQALKLVSGRTDSLRF